MRPPRSPNVYVESLHAWARSQSERGKPAHGGSMHPIRTVGILGAGMMGTAVAAGCLHAGLRVVLHDAEPASLENAPARIAGELAALMPAAPHRLDARPEAAAADLRVSPSLDELGACDLILESIPEDLAVKQAAYARLEPRLRPDCVIGTNTSTIPIGRLSAGLKTPERFCGIHFFHPVRRRPLVEIVRGPQTAQAIVSAAVAFAGQVGKTPIVVSDGPGFLVNRLLSPYLTEAFELLMDGASIESVENAAREFGMEMGPLRLVDEIGLDVAFRGGRVLYEAFGDRIVVSPLWVAMLKSGRLGRKRGAGFFRYPDGLALDEPGRPDPAVVPILQKWRRNTREFSADDIIARLFLPMVVEATRILQERRVEDPRAIDLGVLLGLGFPRSRGGLLYWANGLSAAGVLDALRPLEPLGDRMCPTVMLVEMADRGADFPLVLP
jgi:3-hydroxyacyl-CoA dehydrogenase